MLGTLLVSYVNDTAWHVGKTRHVAARPADKNPDLLGPNPGVKLLLFQSCFKVFNAKEVEPNILDAVLLIQLLDQAVELLNSGSFFVEVRGGDPLSQVWGIAWDNERAEFGRDDAGSKGHIAWWINVVVKAVSVVL